MNKEFEIKGNKVFVKQTAGIKIERKISSNIKEILISENDIEVMLDMIEKEEKELKENKKNIRQKTLLHLPVGIMWGISATMHFFIGNIVTGSLFGLNCFLQCGIALSYLFPKTKYIKISKQKIDLIKKNRNEEKENLNNLINTKEENLNYITRSEKNLSTSEKIYKLKRKLEVIEYYNRYKREYIKYFKKGILEATIPYLFDKEEMNFLIELIKNDLDNKNLKVNNNEKSKQKIITK